MKKAIGVSLGVAAAASVAWLARSPRAEPAPAPAPVVVAAPAPVAPPAVSPREENRVTGCQFKAGERLAYRYSLTSRSELDVSELAGQPTAPLASANRVTATVELEVARADARAAVLVGEYRHLEAQSDVSAADLAPPFLVEIDASCALTRFARASAATRHGARAQQALLWEANWATPTGPGSLEGRDGTGAYTAALSRGEDGAITRRLEGYTALWGQQGAAEDADGQLVVQPGAGPWLAAAQGSLAISFGTQRRSSQLSLTRVTPEPARVLGGAPLREEGFVWEDLLPIAASAHARRPVTPQDVARRGAVASLTPAEALATLTTRAAAKDSLERQWPDLAAWLEVHPEATKAVVQELREERVPVEAVDGLFIALGNARTTDARDTLLSLKRDLAAPPPIRMRAMFALVDREDVGPDLARELATDAQALEAAPTRTQRFLGAESLLALTTMSGLQGSPEISQVAREAVQQALAPRAAPRTRKVALKALGNLGDGRMLTLAEPSTRDGDWKVREAAAFTFRRVPVAESEPMVRGWLAREPHELVKRQVLRTLEVQHFMQHQATSEAMTRALLPELAAQPNLLARRALIRMLGRSAIKDDPAVRAALVRQARVENEKGSGLLNEISKYLTPEEIREVLR